MGRALARPLARFRIVHTDGDGGSPLSCGHDVQERDVLGGPGETQAALGATRRRHEIRRDKVALDRSSKGIGDRMRFGENAHGDRTLLRGGERHQHADRVVRSTSDAHGIPLPSVDATALVSYPMPLIASLVVRVIGCWGLSPSQPLTVPRSASRKFTDRSGPAPCCSAQVLPPSVVAMMKPTRVPLLETA